MFYLVKKIVVILGLMIKSGRNYGDPLKNLTLNLPPFEVTQSHRKFTDRSTIYDFLLMIRSTVSLSRSVSDANGNFSQKSQIFPHLEVPLGIFNGCSARKN